jgi:hypothetical protein
VSNTVRVEFGEKGGQGEGWKWDSGMIFFR